MEKIYRVSYVLSGITERTDDFAAEGSSKIAETLDGWNVATMNDDSVESAVKAIQEKFNGVWGFDPDAIEIKSIVCGHYEYRKAVASPPFFKGTKTFVAD